MTEKKLKTESSSGKRKPFLIPVSDLQKKAKQIAMLRPNETIILNDLKQLYVDAFETGYQRRIGDSKYFKAKRERKVKESFNSLLTTIEDTIHGGLISSTKVTKNNN